MTVLEHQLTCSAVEEGDRIAQLVLEKIATPEVVEVQARVAVESIARVDLWHAFRTCRISRRLCAAAVDSVPLVPRRIFVLKNTNQVVVEHAGWWVAVVVLPERKTDCAEIQIPELVPSARSASCLPRLRPQLPSHPSAMPPTCQLVQFSDRSGCQPLRTESCRILNAICAGYSLQPSPHHCRPKTP